MNWQELYKYRMDICVQCPHYQKNLQRCMKCGCFLKFKARMPRMKCPIDKWDK